LIELRADGFTIRQALPLGPGLCLARQHEFTLCETDRGARAVAYLASRLTPYTRPSNIAVAESTQKGIVTFGHSAADAVRPVPAVADFRRQLAALIPMLGLVRPPNE
jgi:hypothetical protein